MDKKFKVILFSVIAFASLLLPKSASAQQHDPDKYNQIRSMENGDWYFSPGWYYYMFHKKYSGAYKKWEWRGFKSGYVIKFDEKKSNVKRVFTPRSAQVPLEALTIRHLDNQIDSIQPLVTEESIRTGERMIDIVYPQYEEDFKTLGESITESLSYSSKKSNGKLTEACYQLQMEYDVICSSIEYIHKQGPQYGIETTKRQLAYEEAKKKMTKLAQSCSKLARLAATMD